MNSLKKLLFVVLFIFLLSTTSDALEVSPGPVDFSNLHYNQTDIFGQDVLVAASEPEGPVSGLMAYNGIIWVAINDTTINPGRGILFYKSTNGGVNWALHSTAIQPAFIADQVKMLRSGDSTYCFFRIGTSIYKFNTQNNSFFAMPQTAVTQFDIVSSSTNSLYLYYANATQVLRTGSIDGGYTWANNGTVTTNVAPTLGISATGDTLDVLFRAAGGNTTAITRFRYRETAPGVLATTGSSLAILAAGPTRTMYRSYRYGNVEWILYTEGNSPATDLNCIISTDGGNTYAAPITISSSSNGDNPWFAAGISTQGSFRGIDLFFITDSAGTSSDKLKYVYSSTGAPNFPAARVPVSDFIPAVSSRNYVPAAIEVGNSNVGVAYVGINGGNRNVYWDSYGPVTNIHQNTQIADKYELKQNYPNPFNPSTTISFSIPKSDFVSLKVFDMTGKEVADLINRNLSAGNYDFKFDASKLTSGVYFYKFSSGENTFTKKMMLVK